MTGVDDFIADGPQPYTIKLVPTDGELPELDVDVINDDNDMVGVTVTPTLGLTTTEAGGQATFTVVLDSQPTASVAIPVASSTPTEGTVSTAQLMFTSDDWNAPKTVTVTGVEDMVADGPQAYTILLGPATSDDPGYNGLDPDDVQVTNLDDDTPGIVVTPTSGLVTTESGGTAQFTVVLLSQPTADVTIAVASSAPAEASAAPASLVFTSTNWNAPQTVTVTGVDDSVADGDQPFTIVLSPAVSSDAGYSGLDPDDVTGTNLDNDTAGVIVTPTSGLVTTEGGGQATFSVVLRSQPSAEVAIPVASNDLTEGTVSTSLVKFTAANWNAPQIVTVTGVDDALADGDQPYTIVLSPVVSTDLTYNGLDPDDVSVTNLDNDSAGVQVTPTAGLVTTESGGQATFQVVLTSQPTADVTIPVASNDTSEGTVSTPQLVFTTASWNAPQTVTITGVDDSIADGDQPYRIVLGPAVSGDPAYAGKDPPDVSVTNRDNDTAGVLVSPTSGLVTTEAGGTAQFTVVLLSQPTADVTIPISSSDLSEGAIAQAQLVFTSANWNAPQTVVVTGVDDTIADGNQPYSIVLGAAISADPGYAGLDPADVSCTNLDNESGGIQVSPTSGLVTTEAGGTAHFTVVLLSQPTADVTIPIASSDLTEGTVAISQLVFTSANWNAPQTVTVTGVDDAIADGNQPYRIVLSAATSGDPLYNGVDPPDVGVTNLDDDSPGVRVVPTSGLVTTESGGTAQFTVVLLSQPTANVTMPVTTTRPTEGVPSPSSLTFTPANWNAPQTVTIFGKDDFVADGDQPYRIVIGKAVSADPGYNGIDPPDVSVTNLDNDTAGIVATPASGLVTTESGGTAQFTVVLRSQPLGNVTIPLTSSNAGEGVASPAQLVFTPASWNAPQTVTVTGIDDAIADGNQSYQIILGTSASSDPAYNGLGPSSIGCTNLDNDSPGVQVTPTSGLVTSEAGTTAHFTVVLLAQPSADVTIPVASSNVGEGLASPSSLVFTAADWNVPKTVTVAGVDDAVADGDQLYTIVLAPATSSDAGYNGLDPADVTATNLDNDIARVLVTPTSGLVTTEFGDTATFTITLTKQPTAGVTITLTVSDSTEGLINPSSVTFTPANWSVPRTITVAGRADTIVDGNVPYTVVTHPAVSTDPAYSGLDAADVTLTNLDAQTPQVIVLVQGTLETSEAGGSATFQMRLSTDPSAPVTCALHSSDLTEDTVTPAMLTFAPGSSGYQTVTVVGVADGIVDGDQLVTVVTSACTSADPSYDGQDPRDVAVINHNVD